MYYNRKKQMIKSAIMITFILLVAIGATHHIYYKFKSERNVDYNSESLDIVFHEKSGDKITLTKITPVTDAVGLSSKAYTFTIKNNLTIPVEYKIKVIDDLDTILADNCSELQIPKEMIHIAIKNDKDTQIFTLSELEDGTLLDSKIKALDEKEYTVRIWTTKNTLQSGIELHYHARIQIIENNTNVAVAK